MRLSEVAPRAGLTVVRDADVTELDLLAHAGPRSLVYAATPELAADVAARTPAAAIVTPAAAASIPAPIGLATADDPEAAFYRVHAALADTPFYWEDFDTEIDPRANVHDHAYLAPRNVRIGPGCVVEPNATILERVVLGRDVIVRAGAILGAAGFEFKANAMRQGRPSRADYRHEGVDYVVHAGSVRIGDRVEIQAGSTIDRSLFRAPTSIGDDTKLDNLVHVAHSVRIGKRTLIAAGATIAGSVTIGDEVWIGPGAVISSGLTIGDGAAVVIGTTVIRDVAPNTRVANDFKLYKLP